MNTSKELMVSAVMSLYCRMWKWKVDQSARACIPEVPLLDLGTAAREL